MILSRSFNALALATVLFLPPVLANAKPHYYTHHRHYGYGYGGRWCRLDSSPRDPLYFKKADNRCEGVIW
jgi:hypothetical protein